MPDWDTGECGARHDDVTSITCHRPKGHRRDHEGVSTVTWEQDDRFCTTHGRAHWDDGDRTCQFTDDPADGEPVGR